MLPAPALLLYEIALTEGRAAQSEEMDTAHLLVAAAKLSDLDIEAALGQEASPEFRSLVRADAEHIALAFKRANLDAKAFRRRLRYLIHQQARHDTTGKSNDKPKKDKSKQDEGEVLHRTVSARRAFDRAGEMSEAQNAPPLSLHVLRAVLERPESPWREVMEEMGVDNPLQSFFDGEDEAVALSPALDHFGRDLTMLARDNLLSPVLGRRDEIVRLGQILASARKGNALLLGAAGVGKTAIVEGLAQRLATGGLPPALEGRRLVEVPLAALLAGAAYRGQWEERLQAILKEAETSNAILFFDEIHTLTGAGGTGASDAAQILKPALARGALRVIGATTPEEYARTIERDDALARRFEIVRVEEPNRATALLILQGLKPRLEAHHNVAFSDMALDAAIELSIRFLPDLKLPDKALDALDAAASASRMSTLSFRPDEAVITIGPEEVAMAVARRARVPLEQVAQSDSSRLLNLAAALQGRVVGQDAAIEAVSNALKLSSGFKAPHKPHAVFLFAGASGVGKTELAKALADALYGDEKSLLRFDMSEYGEAHTVSRLLGAPPGYVGHDEGGQLSKAVRERPSCVVLFDEIEKAHPDVWNIWLQLFDEGHVTDARGRRVDFCETVVVLTTNLGANIRRNRAMGLRAAPVVEGRDEFRDDVLGAIKSALRPELLGRIGEILVFEPLSPQAARRIAEIALDDVAGNLARRDVRLTWDETLLDLLAREGCDDQSGARAMKRAVERLVARPLAEALLRGEIKGHVRAIAENDAVAFQPQKPGGPVSRRKSP